MVKSKNIIAGLGVVAGLGMALLPLGGVHATDCTGTGDQVGCVAETPAHYIRAHVGEIISISMTSNKPMTELPTTHSRIELKPNELNNTLIHTVSVTSNARGGYKLLLKADNGALRLITAYNDDKTVDTTATGGGYSSTINIPGIQGTDSALNSGAGWGYKVAAHTEDAQHVTTTQFGSGNWLKVPTEYGSDSVVADTVKDGSTNKPYHTEVGQYTEKYDFNYGIRAAADQPSGSYEDKVTYKAVANVLGDA